MGVGHIGSGQHVQLGPNARIIQRLRGETVGRLKRAHKVTKCSMVVGSALYLRTRLICLFCFVYSNAVLLTVRLHDPVSRMNFGTMEWHKVQKIIFIRRNTTPVPTSTLLHIS